MEILAAKLVKVGNSRGVILPKKALDKIGATGNELQLTITDESISITALKKNVRAGWDKAFKKMHKAGDDKPVFPVSFNDEDTSDWKW